MGDEFRNFISDAGVIDLETTNPFFTWRSSHSGTIIASRLDRTLVSDSFVSCWGSLTALVLPRVVSDHHFILLKCDDRCNNSIEPFKFQIFWTSHADFASVVKQSWEPFISARDLITVCVRKLKRLKVRLKDWNFATFIDIFALLKEKQTELWEILKRVPPDNIVSARELHLINEINVSLKNRHLLMLQRSWCDWLTDGDKNTEFFHRLLCVHCGRSNISSLLIDDVISEDRQ